MSLGRRLLLVDARGRIEDVAALLAVAEDGTEIWADVAKSGRVIAWAMRDSVRHDLEAFEIQRQKASHAKGDWKPDVVRYTLR
jgi:hypothetical protein